MKTQSEQLNSRYNKNPSGTHGVPVVRVDIDVADISVANNAPRKAGLKNVANHVKIILILTVLLVQLLAAGKEAKMDLGMKLAMRVVVRVLKIHRQVMKALVLVLVAAAVLVAVALVGVVEVVVLQT